jgi:hypothetical protein
MNYAIGNTNIIHGKRPIFNGFTKILSDFITVVDEGANTKLIIDHDGTGALNNLVAWRYYNRVLSLTYFSK